MPADADSTPSLTPSSSASEIPVMPAQPDHFYPPDGQVQPGHSWLSPDDDPLATKGIPVFKPTMEEFADFEAYMTRVESWGMRSGIVKIIPPKEWSDALPSVCPQLANVRIKSPIEQHMLGRAGVFRQQNIEKRKEMSVREWAELCAKEDYRAPAVDEVGLKSAGEHTPHIKKRNKRKAGSIVHDSNSVVKDISEDAATAEDSVSVQDVTTPAQEVDADSEDEVEAAEDNNDDATPSEQAHVTGRRKRRFPTRSEREAASARRAELNREFLETFEPGTHWLPRNTSPSDYTPSFCSTLERRYWRNCGLGKPPWYGADSAGSLFTDATTEWNVSSLPSALSRLLPKSSAGLPGVNTPYLYFGMWRATFAWHVEDMDLFSINYIHFGAPKFWYAVPQGRAMQLENTLRSFFPRDGEKCRQFLRHKSFLASPNLLAQSSCKPNTLVQHAGEFVITYPRGYHAGFNLGFNCAESVNFALDSWLDIGRRALACGCVGDSVRIDVDALLRAREEEDLLESAKSPTKSRSKRSESDSNDNVQADQSRKRKHDDSDHPTPKKQRIRQRSGKPQPGSSSSNMGCKIMLKVPKDLGPYPCCLCVSRVTEGLLRVHEPPNVWSGCQNVVAKDDLGQAVWRAHERCALVVPETWVDEVHISGRTEKLVFGVDAIVKDRWSLKCSLCQKSRARVHGAPIQCTKGKCPKAFHISCAREGGQNQEARIQFTELREVEKEVILYEIPPVMQNTDPTVAVDQQNNVSSIDSSTMHDRSMPADGDNKVLDQEPPEPKVVKTIKKIEYELHCTQHNPAVVAARRANKVDRVRSDLLSLPAMSRIKLRVSAGVFEVSLLSVNEERNTVEVIWDQGIKREFKWSSLVWGKTDQAVGQKPTVAAPPHEQEARSRLNVRFSNNYSNDRSTLPVVTHLPSGAASLHSASASPYPSATGQFSYGGTWANSYYPNASSYGANTSFSQAPYPYYTYSSSYPPPMTPLSWPSSTPSSTQSPFIAPLTGAFQQVIASSVASLPPRSELPSNSTPVSPNPSFSFSPDPKSSEASSKNSSELSTSRMPTLCDAITTTMVQRDGKLPPGIDQALEELQKLSTMDSEKLKELLTSQPALAEAVKVIVERHSPQTLAQAA